MSAQPELKSAEELIQSVQARARLAGSNKMEVLLFTLGTREIFGINVFKVREVMRPQPATRTPNLPKGVEGVTSLRGSIIPVIDLAYFVARPRPQRSQFGAMMVTEYSQRTQAFLVASVDRIVRIDWHRVRTPDAALAGSEQIITAIAEHPEGGLVSIVDVEQVLANAFGEEPVPEIAPVYQAKPVFFADDSAVARRLISQVLAKMGVKYHHAVNGREAWERLQNLAARAEQQRTPLRDELGLVLTDAEMPEMDGYVLTRNIKTDPRFADIPVVMHSSLSSRASRAMGAGMGADAYVAKFDAHGLAETLRPLLVP